MHPRPRIVAIDMDGTLLPTTSTAMSARNARALRAAQEAGITVAIATGRRVAYTVPLLEGHGLRPDMPVIASNGAVVLERVLRNGAGALSQESIPQGLKPL